MGSSHATSRPSISSTACEEKIILSTSVNLFSSLKDTTAPNLIQPMSNIPISDIAPSEIPDGFTFADPTGSAAGGGAPSQSSNDAAAQREAQRQAILEQAMTPEALARLRRVKLVKKERASAVEAMIANMALQGKIDSKITEGKLIEMLEGIVGAQQKQAADAGKIHIQRKKYNFDSDDEDDNDDDLL